MLLLKSLVAWLLILIFAVANGALREAVLIPTLGKVVGLILSGALLSLVVVLVAYGLVHVERSITVHQALRVGVLWLSLTLAFEFGVGRYFQHKSWDELLDAYMFKEGNIWSLVLLVTLLAPYIAAMLRKQLRHANGGT